MSDETPGATAAPRAQPHLPWSGEPTRADKWCWGLIAAMGIYGLAMIPLRPYLLGLSTTLLALVSGSSIALVDIGAGIRDGSQPWWWALLLVATLQVAKFDAIYFWAGRLWGHGLIEVMAGRSKRAARGTARAVAIAERWAIPGVFVSWFLPFIPTAAIIVVAGAAKMRWRTFLAVDLLAALLNRAVYLYLGYAIGEPAKRLIDEIARWSTYISIALIVVIVVPSVVRSSTEAARQARAEADGAAASPVAGTPAADDERG